MQINNKSTEKDFISQIVKNTFWLRDEIKKQTSLNIFIKPIIIFTNAFVKIPQSIKNISVINKKYLTRTLEEISRKTNATIHDSKNPTLFNVLQALQDKSSDE